MRYVKNNELHTILPESIWKGNPIKQGQFIHPQYPFNTRFSDFIPRNIGEVYQM